MFVSLQKTHFPQLHGFLEHLVSSIRTGCNGICIQIVFPRKNKIETNVCMIKKTLLKMDSSLANSYKVVLVQVCGGRRYGIFACIQWTDARKLIFSISIQQNRMKL